MINHLLMCQNARKMDMSTPVSLFADTASYPPPGINPMYLRNGWIVVGLYNSTDYTLRFFISKDYGMTWTALCRVSGGSTLVGPAATSRGTKIYLIYTDYSTAGVVFIKFDAATVLNIDMSSTRTLIANYNGGYGDSAIAVSSKGELAISWMMQGGSYYNVFAAKSMNDGVSWTKFDGTTGYDNILNNSTVFCVPFQPSIIYVNEKPMVLICYRMSDSTSNAVYLVRYTTSWQTPQLIEMYYGGSYPNMGVLYRQPYGANAGRLWAIWNYAANAIYTFSDDGGVTWAARATLPQNYGMSRQYSYYPKLVCDKKGRLSVMYTGMYTPVSSQYYSIWRNFYTNGSWGTEILFIPMTATSTPYFGISDTPDFDEPIMVYWWYPSGGTPKFRGIFYV